MQFLYPSFLWALGAIAIPVIIHLFYFRRFKKVYFTNVRYLKEIKEETSNKNKLKNLLVLLARILAVACLVLAFAQPFIPGNSEIKSGTNAVSIFVDNSFSMTSAADEIPLLDIAKETARDIVQAYGEADRFQILTHALEGKHQRLISKDDALTYIDEIDYSPFVQQLEVVTNRQRQLLETENANRIIYIISDFQKSITNISNKPDSLMEINLIPLQSTRSNNVSVDSVWLDGPVALKNQINKLIVKVKNNSNSTAEQVKLSIFTEGQEKPVGIRDIGPNSYIVDTIPMSVTKAGWQSATVSVTDFPVQFDDKYYISFQVPDTIKALSIYDEQQNRYLNALFEGISYFSLDNQKISQLNYQTFGSYNLIILNDLKGLSSGLNNELTQYVRGGGKVLIFPGKSADITSYNQFLAANNANGLGGMVNLKKEVAGINTEEFIFNEVYISKNSNLKLPATLQSYTINRTQSRGEESLLSYRDGSPFLAKYINGDGQVFLCVAPLDTEFNDLALNAEIFVPMLYKMAVSRSKHESLSYPITNKVIIETDNKRRTGDYVYKLKGKEEFIPGQQTAGNRIFLDLGNQITEAGVFDLFLDDNVVGSYAFNYDRKESDLSVFAESELATKFAEFSGLNIITSVAQANIGDTISNKDKGLMLWKWFIIATLIFIGLEILLLRFWKT